MKMLVEEFQDEVDNTQGKNEGLNIELAVQFLASSYAGVVEWWFMNDRPVPHEELSRQLGALLERIGG
ncbi:hypothetical protein D3C73_1355340 [compost metagenome]